MTAPPSLPLSRTAATAPSTASLSEPCPDGLQTTAVDWPDAARGEVFAAWLAGVCSSHGLRAETLRHASADASFRRYFRVNTAAGGSCIIMDAPPAVEDCVPFARIAALMQDAGLNAPRVLD